MGSPLWSMTLLRVVEQLFLLHQVSYSLLFCFDLYVQSFAGLFGNNCFQSQRKGEMQLLLGITLVQQ